MRCLLRGANQLICFDEPCRCSLDSYEFRRSRLTLTEFGRKVLNGKADMVAFNGIDRWIGGVHLEGHDCKWRWNAAARQIVGLK